MVTACGTGANPAAEGLTAHGGALLAALKKVSVTFASLGAVRAEFVAFAVAFAVVGKIAAVAVAKDIVIVAVEGTVHHAEDTADECILAVKFPEACAVPFDPTTVLLIADVLIAGRLRNA